LFTFILSNDSRIYIVIKMTYEFHKYWYCILLLLLM